MDPERSTQGRGRLGEDLAAAFLESRGYLVLHRNLRVARREIDLVARRGGTLVAVEVKWRRGEAGDAWRPAQRARGGEAWLSFLASTPGAEGSAWRFDLITIEERADGWTLTHRRAAWTPRGSFW